MLATLRRGPLAAPTEEERLEFLLTRKKKNVNLRKGMEQHAMEHVLSFQRRVAAIKKDFLPRGKRTPLGIPLDYWDRTEAQQRGACIRTPSFCVRSVRLRRGGGVSTRLLGVHLG